VKLDDEDWEYRLGRLLEALERHGLIAKGEVDDNSSDEAWDPATTRRFSRTFDASRRRALDSVAGAVEALNYKERKVAADAAQVAFNVLGRSVVAKVVDAGTNRSTVVVELKSVKASVLALGAGATTILTGGIGVYSFAAWPALRAWERAFSKGFLDNVQRVLEGREIGYDSAVPLGLKDKLSRPRDV
jgi:hypothetical protein